MTKHRLIKANKVGRDIYRCQGCRNRTLKCRLCDHMAKGATNWDDEFCAEHFGQIPSFKRAKKRIKDLTQYEDIFRREVTNIRQVGALAAGTAGVAAAFTPLAIAAAPGFAGTLGAYGLLGAAGTGTAISSLSGAALASSSLAAIGGSVAAGTAIVTATGTALGAAQGVAIANAYFGDVKGFHIKKIKRGKKHGVICVNGFLTENETEFLDWKKVLPALYPTSTWYGVTWESKNLKKLGQYLSNSPKAAAISLAKEMGKRATKKNKMAVLELASSMTDAIKNPWHSAMKKAAMTGVMLADAIARTDKWTFTLVGHSLGARVIYYTLEALATKKGKFVVDVHLLGGAVGAHDSAAWKKAAQPLAGTLYNYYSRNDFILKSLYRPANAYLSVPIGYSPIQGRIRNVTNVDCTDNISDHQEWKDMFGIIAQSSRPRKKVAA